MLPKWWWITHLDHMQKKSLFKMKRVHQVKRMQHKAWGKVHQTGIREDLLHLCSAFLDLAETSITLFVDTQGAYAAGYQNQPYKGSRKDGTVSSAGGKDDSSASALI